jgi:hypothetical protein
MSFPNVEFEFIEDFIRDSIFQIIKARSLNMPIFHEIEEIISNEYCDLIGDFEGRYFLLEIYYVKNVRESVLVERWSFHFDKIK